MIKYNVIKIKFLNKKEYQKGKKNVNMNSEPILYSRLD